jgi:beta-phosphoglucomutase-like phosphatase (HAD superfamily)
MPIAAVVFDFDGVIADTEHLHLGAFREAFAERGWTLDEADYFGRYIGFDDRGLVVAYADDRRIPLGKTILKCAGREEGRVQPAFVVRKVLFPGAKGAIERIARASTWGLPGALHQEIAAILKVAGLIDLFPVIIGADDVTATKPSPEPYLAAAAKLGIAPSGVRGDRRPVTDFRPRSGMRTIAETARRSSLAGADPVASLAQVTPELVANLGPQQPRDSITMMFRLRHAHLHHAHGH